MHELDSESDEEPSSFDASDFGWNSHSNVESDVDIVVTCASTSTGWLLAPINFLCTLLPPFQRCQLFCFHSNTVFLIIYDSLLYSLHTHKIWKRSVEKY